MGKHSPRFHQRVERTTPILDFGRIRSGSKWNINNYTKGQTSGVQRAEVTGMLVNPNADTGSRRSWFTAVRRSVHTPHTCAPQFCLQHTIGHENITRRRGLGALVESQKNSLWLQSTTFSNSLLAVSWGEGFLELMGKKGSLWRTIFSSYCNQNKIKCTLPRPGLKLHFSVFPSIIITFSRRRWPSGPTFDAPSDIAFTLDLDI